MTDAPRTRRPQHTLALAVLVTFTVLVLAGASAFSVLRLMRLSRTRDADELRRTAMLLAGELARQPGVLSDAQALRPLIAGRADVAEARLTVFAPDGRVILDSHASPADLANVDGRPEILAAERDGIGTIRRNSEALQRRFVYVAVPVRVDGRTAAFVRAARDDSHLASALEWTIPLFTYLAIGSGVVLALGHIARKRVSRQGEKLLESAESSAARLAESERRLAEAQRVANLGSWVWDPDADVATWSDHLYRMLGIEPGSIPAGLEQYLEFVHPDDRDAVRMASARAIHDGIPMALDSRIVRADGTTIVVYTQAELIRDADGRAERLVGTLLDVTDLRKSEQARRAAEEQFRAFVETTNEWVWMIDTRGTLLYSNAAVTNILGYAPADLIDRVVIHLIHPADRAAFESSLSATGRDQTAWSGIVRRWLHRDGAWRYLESSGTPIVEDAIGVVGFHGSSRDITGRTIAEEAFRKSEERFQLAARASNDVLWDWDFTTGEIWRSEGIRRLFGHSDDMSPLAEWDALLHPDERMWVAERLKEFLDSDRETWTAEYRLRRGDGTYAWILDRGIVVRDAGGRPLRMIGTMMDITERKESERMKSDFVSFVSHQLRTPLSGMNWMLELAAEAEGLPRQAQEYIAEARQSAARLGTLVNDLLDIARLESGRTAMTSEPISLADVTASVLREMHTVIVDKRHTVGFQASAASTVVGDAQMVRQVIANLVSNALKYTPDGGRVTVRITQRNDLVEWRVEDNGMGIPRGAQARLFEKFFRADNAVSKEAEGTGLGLHLVRLVIEQAGGQVWCESQEGQGSTFAFTLPVAQQHKETL